jgi:uracil-DNA glycosylase
MSRGPLLVQGLEAIMAATPDYLPQLAQDDYLPTGQRLFAAFALPLEQVRCAGGGGALSACRQCHRRQLHGWGGRQPVVGPAGGGLSKPVNKATSLRNFMKMLLVADGQLDLDDTGSEAMARIALRAQEGKGSHILTLAELQDKLMEQGFLLLNAALVFRPHVAPVKDAKAWLPFFETVMAGLAEQARVVPTLILWGKIAETLSKLPLMQKFPQIRAEHPYNLSFIGNADMHALFGPMKLLQGRAAAGARGWRADFLKFDILD